MNYNTFYFSFIPSLYSPLTAVHALATMQRRNIGALHSPLTTVPALAHAGDLWFKVSLVGQYFFPSPRYSGQSCCTCSTVYSHMSIGVWAIHKSCVCKSDLSHFEGKKWCSPFWYHWKGVEGVYTGLESTPETTLLNSMLSMAHCDESHIPHRTCYMNDLPPHSVQLF